MHQAKFEEPGDNVPAAQAGDDQQIFFLLYRDGGSEPYRTLRLWINVTAD